MVPVLEHKEESYGWHAEHRRKTLQSMIDYEVVTEHAAVDMFACQAMGTKKGE
jgi:hypothetical protein